MPGEDAYKMEQVFFSDFCRLNLENRPGSFGNRWGAMGSIPRGARYRYTPVGRGLKIIFKLKMKIRCVYD